MAATHPDVIAAHAPWRDVSLFLEEAHHSLAVDETASRRAGHRVQPNALGQIVTHYVSEKATPLTLITATWMRTDDGRGLPSRTSRPSKRTGTKMWLLRRRQPERGEQLCM